MSKQCPICQTEAKQITVKGEAVYVCPNRVKNPDGSYSGCSWKGEWPSNGKPKMQVETLTELCPICQHPLVIKTFASGKRMKDCSNKRYDPNTKHDAEGSCDFKVVWL